MSDLPLPPELSKHFGTLPDIKYRGGNEWSSACPKCGGAGHRRDLSDRFRMFNSNGPPRAWCRQCNYKVTGNQLSGDKMSKQDFAAYNQHRTAWLEQENDRLKRKIAWLQSQPFWREWHTHMTEQGRKLWHKAGIDDSLINIHKLGFTTSRYESCGGALTIPYLHYDGIQTLQFRLLEPPGGDDKYRFLQGTRSTWFHAWPNDEIEGVVLVVEGAKKALVTWRTIATLDQFTYRGRDVKIIATPSKHVPNHMLDELEKAELVIWLLDPDAYVKQGKTQQSALLRNAKAVGLPKSRIVRTVMKIDDMIVEHKLKGATVQNMVRQASPISRRQQ